MEKWDRKPFCNTFEESDRMKFHEIMFVITRLYISSCSNSVQYVILHPILISIVLYNYKKLTEWISEVERIETKVNNKKKPTRTESVFSSRRDSAAHPSLSWPSQTYHAGCPQLLVILLDAGFFQNRCILRALPGCSLSTRNSMAAYLVGIHLAF
jgi:hypothetical protein